MVESSEADEGGWPVPLEVTLRTLLDRAATFFDLDGELAPRQVDELREAYGSVIDDSSSTARSMLELSLADVSEVEAQNLTKLAAELGNLLNAARDAWLNAANQAADPRLQTLRAQLDGRRSLEEVAGEFVRTAASVEALVWTRTWRRDSDLIRIEAVADEISDDREAVESAVSRVEGIEQTLRATASEQGFRVHAERFKSEAAKHRKASFWALGAASLLLTMAVAATVIVFAADSLRIDDELSGGALANSVVIRLAIPTALYFGAVTALRIYRAHLHNRTVNQHRAIALETVDVLAEAGLTEPVRNLITLEASRTVFAHQSTGFTRSSDEGNESNSTMLEVIRDAGGSGSS